MNEYLEHRAQEEELWRTELLALMWCGISKQEIRENLEAALKEDQPCHVSAAVAHIKFDYFIDHPKDMDSAFDKAIELITDACDQKELPNKGHGFFSKEIRFCDFRDWVKTHHPDSVTGELFDDPDADTRDEKTLTLAATQPSEMAWRSRIITVFHAAMIWCGIPEEDFLPARLAYKGVYLEDTVDKELYSKYVQKREEIKQAMMLVVDDHHEAVVKQQLDEGNPKEVERWTVSQGAFFDWIGSRYPDDVKNLRPHVAPIMTEAERKAERAEIVELLAETNSPMKSSNDNEVQQGETLPIQNVLNVDSSAARIQDLEAQLADAHCELKELKLASSKRIDEADKLRKGKGANADLELIGALFLYLIGDDKDIEPHPLFKGKTNRQIREAIAARHPNYMVKAQATGPKIQSGLERIGEMPLEKEPE